MTVGLLYTHDDNGLLLLLSMLNLFPQIKLRFLQNIDQLWKEPSIDYSLLM